MSGDKTDGGARLERIPRELDEDALRDWVQSHEGMRFLGTKVIAQIGEHKIRGRGAWDSETREYMRGAEYVGYIGGKRVGFVYESELDDWPRAWLDGGEGE